MSESFIGSPRKKNDQGNWQRHKNANTRSRRTVSAPAFYRHLSLFLSVSLFLIYLSAFKKKNQNSHRRVKASNRKKERDEKKIGELQTRSMPRGCTWTHGLDEMRKISNNGKMRIAARRKWGRLLGSRCDSMCSARRVTTVPQISLLSFFLSFPFPVQFDLSTVAFSNEASNSGQRTFTFRAKRMIIEGEGKAKRRWWKNGREETGRKGRLGDVDSSSPLCFYSFRSPPVSFSSRAKLTGGSKE